MLDWPTSWSRQTNWPALREALTQAPAKATAADVRAIIDRFAAPNAVAPIAAQQSLIDALFGQDSIEEIVTALAHHDSAFAQAGLADHSRQLADRAEADAETAAAGARLDVAGGSVWCANTAPRWKFSSNHDFPEGIRAAVIDKDRNPHWSPARIEDVTPTDHRAVFRAARSG